MITAISVLNLISIAYMNQLFLSDKNGQGRVSKGMRFFVNIQFILNIIYFIDIILILSVHGIYHTLFKR
jgi:hypothetical protein